MKTPLFMRKQPGGVFTVVDETRATGDIWFVNSVTGTDAAGYGQNPDAPVASIDYAVGLATANNGDRIIVMPGHVESVIAAAGLDLDKAGITIVFEGEGNARGRISFGTDVLADMDVDAADITMINPRFVAAIDALTGPIDVNAARFKIVNGTCQDGTTINTTDWVVGDANADDCVIDGLEFIDGDAGGTQKQSFIQFAAATRPVLRRIRATGDFGTGVIENGTAWIDALLDDVVIDNAAAGPVVGILLQATSSGAARNVHVRVASGTTYVTANNDMQWYECYGVGTDAAAGDTIGTVPSASVEGKIDTLQAELSGAAGLAAFPDAAAPANDVSLAEVIHSIWGGLMGTAADENGITTWPAAAAPADTVSLAEAIRYIVETQLGTIANTGGTATIGAILGDLLNVDLATKLGAADGATTESLHGKLGTDTELADRSLYDQINGAGPAAAAAAAAPANDVSLYAAVRYIVETLVGTLVNTGGTATVGGILGDVANVSVATNLAKIGTVTNTGGTATLGAVLGDVANVDLATKLGAADGATTESLHGKLGTDTELADRSVYDLLNGAGPAAAAVAAAPANDVSVYGALRAVYNLTVPAAATGETVIDEGDYNWAADYPALLTIVPAAGAPLADVVVHLDMAKAATGFATTYAAQTIEFRVERKVDGTNWRREALVEAALSGTLAASREMKISIGDVGVTQQVRITAVLSAENGGATETTFPYAVYYKGLSAPTITPLAATP